jgi:stage III sporulation protein AG
MEMMHLEKKFSWKAYFKGLSKYKYIALVVLLGLILLLWPSSEPSDPVMPVHETENDSIESKLAEILSEIDGVGNCCVMLTENSGVETVYQSDVSRQTDETGTQEDTTTVLASAGSGEEPLVVQEYGPVYRGALVVCEGGASPTVQLAIVDAVADLTGLGADQISVIKMK